jgi:hypothetical protein
VQDAIGGYHVTAAGRTAEISLLSAGLLTGVVLGLTALGAGPVAATGVAATVVGAAAGLG